MTTHEEFAQYFQGGDYEKIRQACKKMKTAESFRMIAKSYLGENNSIKAEEYYLKALKKNPKYIESLNELGVIYLNQNKISDAKKCFEQIIKIKPDYMSLNNLAICYVNQNQLSEAEPYFLQAVELDPSNMAPLENLCKAYLQAEKFDNAENVVDKIADILKSDKGLDELYVGIAYCYELKEKYEKAIELNEKALKSNSENYMALNNLGSINLKQNKLFEAEEYYLKSLAIKEDYTLALCNMGNIVKYKGDIAGSLAYYKKAYELGDESETVLSNIGVILTEQGEIEEGIRYYERALTKKPDHRDVLFNYSLSLLLMGDLLNGFKYYEVRKNKTDYIRVEGNEWKGEKNKIVLILPEQGFGDVLQFCRYIPMVKAISSKVIFVCPKPLMELLKSVDGVDEIIEMKDGIKLPAYENYVYMMSLPYIFKTTVDTIPSEYQYLEADEEKVKYWAKKLKKYKGPKVGLVWTGNPRRFSIQLTTIDARRSMKLSQMEPILNVEGITFVNLQKDDDLNQIKDYPQIIDFMPEVKDFSDTAALIENLDLVIAVDTSVVHLAAALTKT